MLTNNQILTKIKIYSRLHHKLNLTDEAAFGMYLLIHKIYNSSLSANSKVNYWDMQVLYNHIQNYSKYSNSVIDDVINYIFSKVHENHYS